MTRKYLDGPRLAAWLRPFAVEKRARNHDALMSLLWRCDHGAITDIYVVDKYLAQLGLTEHDIPDECWLVRTKSPRGMKSRKVAA